MTRVIALTGNIAAGKSAVSELFREWGATIIDADALVRELQQPGTPVMAQIVARFGKSILTAEGVLDRRALRQVIATDQVARHDLEAIVHPAVAIRRETLVAEAAARGDPLVVVDIPLLFEADDPGNYDAVVVVDADESERLRRLVTDRGIPAAEATRLIAMQAPAGPKRAAADFLIENNGSRSELRLAAQQVWRCLTE